METVNWTRELDEMIREAVARYGSNDWGKVCQKLRSQQITPEQCRDRWESVLRDQTVKGPWSEEEDAILRSLVEQFGPKKWSTIASYINGRIGKQCRERWLNHLSPTVSKDVWTEEEDEILINAQIQMGNKWSYISKLLPGRSENAVKNRYNSIASRNGVRKKRLGNFVNRAPSSRSSVLRVQSAPKTRSATHREEVDNDMNIDSSYAELLEKAKHLSSRASQRRQQQTIQKQQLQRQQTLRQQALQKPSQDPPATTEVTIKQEPITPTQPTQPNRNSLPLPIPSIYQHLNNSVAEEQSIDIDHIHETSHTDMFNFPSVGPSSSDCFSTLLPVGYDGTIDVSQMTLPTSTSYSSTQVVQEEENHLQQIDTLLLAGNTIMGGQRDVLQPYDLLNLSSMDNSYSNIHDSLTTINNPSAMELEGDGTDHTTEPSIAPVHMRNGARMNVLNRGVYSSWDREMVESQDMQDMSESHGLQQSKYDSLDLMRLLQSTGDSHYGGFMEDERVGDPIIQMETSDYFM